MPTYGVRDDYDIETVGRRFLEAPDRYLLTNENVEVQAGRVILSADPDLFDEILQTGDMKQ